jgi:uncharacterized protein (DUF58 family)
VGKSRFKYLKPEDIRKLSTYEFAPKYVVEGYLAGRHQSKHQGVSSEFRDYRPYVPGDDITSIDWRIYARTDRYYIRTFEQETNTSCYIMLDSSASMGFGTGLTKLEYSSFFAAALSYLVTKSDNLVSMQLFDDKIRSYYPLGSTTSHLNNLMHVLESNTPGNRTSLSEALRKSVPLFKRKGSLVVISDFFDDPGAIFSALSQYLHRGFKVYLFHILAPEEIHLSPKGLNLFVDMETNSKLIVHADSVKKKYNEVITQHIASLRQMSIRRQVEYVTARTDTHYYKLFDRLVK